MRICMIGPGIMPIPPTGWGGVESLIWNCKQEFENQGHEVMIQNVWLGNNLERHPSVIQSAIDEINEWNPDFVHLHYDHYADIMPRIKSPRAMTSHFPYLDYPDRRINYQWIFQKFADNHSHVFALTDRNAFHFADQGVKDDLIFTWPGGILNNEFAFTNTPILKNRSICLGKVEPRKMQYETQASCPSVDFAGPMSDNRFDVSKNYLGTWTREQVYQNMTNYGNLVLLSDGEAAPQVIMEALVTGLGLVISDEAAANLDTSLPFIDIVSRDDFSNLDSIIAMNREKSLVHRNDIRQYGIEKFGISNCTKKYIEKIEEIRSC